MGPTKLSRAFFYILAYDSIIMKKFILHIVLLNIVHCANAHHPVHMSVINMEFDENTKTIEYSVRLFQEDFTQLLFSLYHDMIHNNNSPDTSQKVVDEYFRNALVLFSDGEEITTVLRKQINTEKEVWLHYYSTISDVPGSLTIKNTIMTDIFHDQVNLLIFSNNGLEEGFTFSSAETEKTILLKTPKR